jgi:hypothetical protein
MLLGKREIEIHVSYAEWKYIYFSINMLAQVYNQHHNVSQSKQKWK